MQIPGLLVIDTPGHEAFANLRRRGGSAADIAMLIVDVIRGLEIQTIESINILKARKTPFLVVATKIDLIPGWRPTPGGTFRESYEKQAPEVRTDLDNRLYTIMGGLSRLGFQSERYDRLRDFRSTLAIVPVSAKTGEGLAELMALVSGLTQVFMKDELTVTAGPARGTILEVKEEPGIGITVNAILYDGILKTTDTIVLGGREAPIVTHVRAILLPKPLDEIRDPRNRFSNVDSASAAAGVKIVAPDLDRALAGSSIYTVPEGEDSSKYEKMIMEEVEKLRIDTEIEGIVLKTDTLGSLEALTELLRDANVPIRLADVGDISRREVVEAETVQLKEPTLGVILGFGVKILPDAEEEASEARIKIFRSEVIYRLMEEYIGWRDEQKLAGSKAELETIVRPGKLQILPGCIFRRSKPAIVGIEVQVGRVKPNYSLMLVDGREIGTVKHIQDEGKDMDEATVNMQVAISIEDAVVGRQINEGDTLYISVPERDVKHLLSRFTDSLPPSELELLKQLVETRRKTNPLWAF